MKLTYNTKLIKKACKSAGLIKKPKKAKKTTAKTAKMSKT
jgi:hypothetical protein